MDLMKPGVFMMLNYWMIRLYSLFTEFSDGVRILVISDSCHSGTVTKNADSNVDSYDTNIGKDGTQYKFLPTKEVNEIYDRNRDYYNKVVENINVRKAIYEVKASAILLSAVQDSQFAVSWRGWGDSVFLLRI